MTSRPRSNPEQCIVGYCDTGGNIRRGFCDLHYDRFSKFVAKEHEDTGHPKGDIWEEVKQAAPNLQEPVPDDEQLKVDVLEHNFEKQLMRDIHERGHAVWKATRKQPERRTGLANYW